MPKFSEADFGHVHVHTERSRLDGCAKIDKQVMRARELGQRFLGCTDHGTVAAWVKFAAECTRKKDKKGNEIPFAPIKPLLGIEWYLSRDHTIHDIQGQPDGRAGNRHFITFAKNWTGYQNLCRLSELSWCKGFYHTPRTDIEQLAKHSEGLVASSACISSVINSCLLNDQYDAAKRATTIFKDIFKEDFFLEVMYHGLDIEAAIIGDVLKLGAQLDIPVIASNDVHYVTQDMARSHEALMCMNTSKCIHDPTHLHFPFDEFYLKSAEEMGRIFGSRPELLYNTISLADRIDSDDIAKNMGGMRLPTFKLPERFTTPQAYLEHLAWEGMTRVGWEHSAPHIAALKMELGDVRVAKDNNNYDFATYFLIKWRIFNNARKKKIYVGPGRGSGYASILLRCLGITYGPDPLKYNLLWPRFLGFDDKPFYLAADFGLTMKHDVDLAAIADAVEDQEAEEDLEAVEEEDAGGISRY
jgi:DNA polymerase-3 subunit alpha